MSNDQTVHVVDYNSNWPRTFEREAQKITNQLNHAVTAIEHVGSTAVPGLSARPIIDIALLRCSENSTGSESLTHLLDTYQICTSKTDLPIQKILKRTENPPDVRLLVCADDEKTGFKRLVRFRELLRTDTELARRFDALKQGLAREFSDDPVTYNAEKSAFIHTLEEVYLSS